MIRPGIQTFLAEAGESACYALDIIEIASRHLGGPIDIVKAILDGIDHGFIRYNWADPTDGWNFYVDYTEKFIEILTGVPWIISKEAADYKAKPGEYVVQRWERQATGQTIGHFRLPDWDSLASSRTVREGKIVSTRVFRRVV